MHTHEFVFIGSGAAIKAQTDEQHDNPNNLRRPGGGRFRFGRLFGISTFAPSHEECDTEYNEAYIDILSKGILLSHGGSHEHDWHGFA